MFHENRFVTNFFEKAELFNSFFSKQCSLINNGSALPTHMQYLTNNRVSSINFSQEDDIAKKSFDEGHEVRGVFLGISKAFDKIWHDGLIFKLTQNGISGTL